MFLQAIRVNNFRAIGHLAMTFERTTVLIGENDTGRSTLFEALDLVLGVQQLDSPVTFQPSHVPRKHLRNDSESAIAVVLTFREEVRGQWDEPAFEPLAPMLRPVGRRRREIVLEARARPDEKNGPLTARCIVRSQSGAFRTCEDPGLVDWIRRMNPLMWLAGGLVVDEPAEPVGSVEDSRHAKLMSLIDERYQKLLHRVSPDPMGEVEAGFREVRDLISSGDQRFVADVAVFGSTVNEIMRAPSPLRAAAADRSLYRRGEAAQKIGVFMLAAALLRKGVARLDEGATPIVVIDDPESHLHPMTAAAALNLLEQINWQKLIGTHSGDLLTLAPLTAIRRLTRREGTVHAWHVRPRSLSREDVRRFTYHVRLRRGAACFARCWLFVEGETEQWILPGIARLCGVDFATEGVAIVEFAQSGLKALIKVAEQLGIAWHLLSDGDKAGKAYADAAEPFIRAGERDLHLTLMKDRDIEHCVWSAGFAGVYEGHAGLSKNKLKTATPKRVIERAIRRKSKPFLAVSALEAMAHSNSPGVPGPLRHAVESCVHLARRAPTLAPDNEARKSKEEDGG